MSVYQIDLLDDEGKVSRSGHVVCRNDQEALPRAARMIGRSQALEIWDGTRVVGQLTWEECWQLKHRSTRPSHVLVRQPSARTGMTVPNDRP